VISHKALVSFCFIIGYHIVRALVSFCFYYGISHCQSFSFFLFYYGISYCPAWVSFCFIMGYHIVRALVSWRCCLVFWSSFLYFDNSFNLAGYSYSFQVNVTACNMNNDHTYPIDSNSNLNIMSHRWNLVSFIWELHFFKHQIKKRIGHHHFDSSTVPSCIMDMGFFNIKLIMKETMMRFAFY
jgi:hypothetical protein